MELQLQQEMQEPMVQLERHQQVKLVPLVEMQADLVLMLEEHLRLALEGHLEVAVEGRILQVVVVEVEVGVGHHLVATLAPTAALPPWTPPLLLTLASPLWCLHLSPLTQFPFSHLANHGKVLFISLSLFPIMTSPGKNYTFKTR